MCNRFRGGGKCLLVLVLSATFLRREYKFREKGGDVATVAMHVAEVKRFADLSRRDAVPTHVQCRNVTASHLRWFGVTVHDRCELASKYKLSGCADKSIAVALQMSSAA